MNQALKIWTGVMVGLGVLIFITQPTYMGCGMAPDVFYGMSACDIGGLFRFLVIGVVWFIGVIVLLIADTRGAFQPADPSTASGPGATAEGPPREQPPPS